MTTGLRGPELLRAAVNHILAHPETFDQGTWHCGSKHCIAGYCQILGGKPENADLAYRDAAELLGLSAADAGWLFAGSRRLPEIYAFAYALLHPEELDSEGYARDGYNRTGYVRDGYDRNGYNRNGYNRAGYDCNGYDHAGYDYAGYNRDGYNHAGYDRDGYNCAGYDRDGYDRDGYDRDGYNRAGYDCNGYDRNGYTRAGYDRNGEILKPL